MTNFDTAFLLVIGVEGGYVNNPEDPGGETKYGISKRAYPDLDIRNLTLAAAKAIYLRDYWTAHHCDQMEWGKALLVFDCAVNGGPADRWYSMFSGQPMADFAVNFQVEHIQYLASLKNWPGNARGWLRRAFKMYNSAVKPPGGLS